MYMQHQPAINAAELENTMENNEWSWHLAWIGLSLWPDFASFQASGWGLIQTKKVTAYTVLTSFS